MVVALKIFYTSVGRKLLMALTGLFLLIFLVEHLYGNLLLYKLDSGKTFNAWGEFLVGNLIIRIVEFGLFGSIILHALDGLFLTLQNRKARPVRYEVSHPSGSSTWFSRNMGFTGTIIFVFLVIHLKTFFLPHRVMTSETSMAHDVAVAFQSNWYCALYIAAMVLLGAHLNHGFQSALHTMGWNNHKYMKPFRLLGSVFALIFMLGFASFPVVFYFDLFGISGNILKP